MTTNENTHADGRRIGIVLPVRDHQRLVDRARGDRLSVSAYVRRLIGRHLDGGEDAHE